MSAPAWALPRATPRGAFGKIVLNEARLAWRYPRGLIFGVGLPTVLLIIFGELPKAHAHKAALGGLTRFDVEVPTLIAMVIALLALQSLPTPLATYREQGILRRLSTTPAPPSTVLAAQLIINLCLALMALFVILVFGAAAFGEHAPRNVGGFVLAILLTLGALFSIGLALAALVKTAGAAHGIAAALFFPLMFFAGLWVPQQEMSPGLREASRLSPLGAAVQAIQDAIQGTFPPAAALLTLAGYAIVFGFLATRYFKWE